MSVASTSSRRRTLWGLAAGLCLLVAAGLLLILQPTAAPAGRTVSDAGTVTTAESDPVAPLAASADPGDPGTVPTAGVDNPPSTVQDAAADRPTVAAPVAPAAPAAELAPVQVALPGLGVVAAIAPVGLDSSGLMEIPVDVDTVGWYRFGPAPGAATGSAVLTGHVDSADQGRGAFADLGLLSPGDRFEVTGADGVPQQFEVVARESWPKDQVPLDRLFDRSGPGRLVLITCGGTFDPAALSYEENLAVTAVLV